jgi:NRAMP (natural resistance-associated macrophage protein)-like metal ion transporter
MSFVQFMCAKIGMVTGRGLAGVLKTHYSRPLVYASVFSLVIANSINAGADIGAIAAGINLLSPISVWSLIVPIALSIIALQIWGSYRFIANVFKWLTLALFAYVVSAFFCKPDLGQVLRATLIPSFPWNRAFLALTVGILGTTISPYMFFWQSNQEVEEEIAAGRKTLAQRVGATDAELKYAALDVNIGMLVSNLVMYFIILSTAATLFKAGEIQGATQAAQALRPLAGRAAEALLALGLIGTGFLAVPILTGSSAGPPRTLCCRDLPASRGRHCSPLRDFHNAFCLCLRPTSSLILCSNSDLESRDGHWLLSEISRRRTAEEGTRESERREPKFCRRILE